MRSRSSPTSARTVRSSRSTGSPRPDSCRWSSSIPGIRRIVPVALRHWRHHLFAASTWREFASFRRALRRERVRGRARPAGADQGRADRAAWRAACGTARTAPASGSPSRRSRTTCITRSTPTSISSRVAAQLAAAALGYRVEGPPRFGLVPPPPPAGTVPDRPFVVFVHGTSRADKLWPDAHWRRLIEAFAASGFAVVLPWGSDAERARSERYAAGVANAHVPPPPRQTLPALAGLLARAELAVGVDTGLVHLAAALGTPTVSLFVATDPMRCGVGPAGAARARPRGRRARSRRRRRSERAAGELMRRAPRC